uniref:Uncharacterized protein n=1 Tax=Zea mays TaxID=4577 RepID=A0A804N2E9_MAIZE
MTDCWIGYPQNQSHTANAIPSPPVPFQWAIPNSKPNCLTSSRRVIPSASAAHALAGSLLRNAVGNGRSYRHGHRCVCGLTATQWEPKAARLRHRGLRLQRTLRRCGGRLGRGTGLHRRAAVRGLRRGGRRHQWPLHRAGAVQAARRRGRACHGGPRPLRRQHHPGRATRGRMV